MHRVTFELLPPAPNHNSLSHWISLGVTQLLCSTGRPIQVLIAVEWVDQILRPSANLQSSATSQDYLLPLLCISMLNARL